jgi:hypothetical protein
MIHQEISTVGFITVLILGEKSRSCHSLGGFSVSLWFVAW